MRRPTTCSFWSSRADRSGEWPSGPPSTPASQSTGLAAQELLRSDKDLGRGERNLSVACLVLHHGDRPWNAPTRLRDLFRDSAPDTYRVVSPRPPEAPPPTPLDLPQMVLAMVGLSTAPRMRDELAAVRQVVEQCEDEDFDRFLTPAVTAMLRSKGMTSEQLEEAMTMGTVATAFQRSLDEIRQEGQEQGIELGREQWDHATRTRNTGSGSHSRCRWLAFLRLPEAARLHPRGVPRRRAAGPVHAPAAPSLHSARPLRLRM